MFNFQCLSCWITSLCPHNSYLKSLLPSFNECTDKLLEGIRPLADGKTTVPMKQHLSEVTLNVISKVHIGLCVYMHIHFVALIPLHRWLLDRISLENGMMQLSA